MSPFHSIPLLAAQLRRRAQNVGHGELWFVPHPLCVCLQDQTPSSLPSRNYQDSKRLVITQALAETCKKKKERKRKEKTKESLSKRNNYFKTEKADSKALT